MSKAEIESARHDGWASGLMLKPRHAQFQVKNTLYNLMTWLSPRDYGGGFWDFYEYEGTPLYLSPASRQHYRIACDTNGHEGRVSADAAGIIATLFTFSHLSFIYQSDVLAEQYNRLYTFAADHPEASEIFQAID